MKEKLFIWLLGLVFGLLIFWAYCEVKRPGDPIILPVDTETIDSLNMEIKKSVLAVDSLMRVNEKLAVQRSEISRKLTLISQEYEKAKKEMAGFTDSEHLDYFLSWALPDSLHTD